MLTVPTTTRQYRRNLPPGRVGKALLMDILETIPVRIGRDICGPAIADRPIRIHHLLPIGLDLPIAA